jgi:antirestriction protein ArdC
MSKCPNCKTELVATDNGYKCPKCIYSISEVKKEKGQGSKYVQQVNRAIKDMLVEARLTGEKVPWKQPWIIIPKRNYDSNRVYNGINRWLLSFTDDVSFITAKSAEKRGCKIKEDAKKSFVICWVPAKLKKDELKLSEEEQKKILKKRFPIMVTHEVFKSKDIEGLPVKKFETDKTNKQFESIEVFIKSTRIEIKTGGNRAAYSALQDVVLMPRIEQFESSEEYYRTILHELAHATGHKSRLNRSAEKFKPLEEYGKEELIAELASAYMCMYFGIEPSESNAQYIDHWLEAIDKDPYLLVSAGQQAEKVLEYFKLA